MNRRTSLPALALAFLLMPICATSDVLRGQISQLDQPDQLADLRVRFFESADSRQWLAERQFDRVALRGGQFLVPFNAQTLPADIRFVEIALRPSERPYAAFLRVPPRRPIDRDDSGTWVAVADAARASNDINPYSSAVTFRARATAHHQRGLPQ